MPGRMESALSKSLAIPSPYQITVNEWWTLTERAYGSTDKDELADLILDVYRYGFTLGVRAEQAAQRKRKQKKGCANEREEPPNKHQEMEGMRA